MTRQGLPTATTFAGQIPNDHACANLSATVVWYEILLSVSLTIVTCAMSNTSFMSSLVSWALGFYDRWVRTAASAWGGAVRWDR